MGQRDASVDVQIFSRTASIFAGKRNVLAPEAVEKLAYDIVQRLARNAGAGAPPPISDASAAAFCDTLIDPEPGAALRFIEERRAEGVTRQGVYMAYIPAAARELGRRWEEDRLSFSEVTVGTGHLYALMRALRAERPPAHVAFDIHKCALFATVPGEDHGIGITIAADMFRDAGWEIDLQVGADHDRLMARIERTRPEVIGLSLSTVNRLEALIRLVVCARLVVPEAIIGVAPGAELDRDSLGGLLDVDLMFGDAGSARTELERLIRARS